MIIYLENFSYQKIYKINKFTPIMKNFNILILILLSFNKCSIYMYPHLVPTGQTLYFIENGILYRREFYYNPLMPQNFAYYGQSLPLPNPNDTLSSRNDSLCSNYNNEFNNNAKPLTTNRQKNPINFDEKKNKKLESLSDKKNLYHDKNEKTDQFNTKASELKDSTAADNRYEVKTPTGSQQELDLEAVKRMESYLGKMVEED